MREDIAQKAKAMQSSQPQVIYSEPQDSLPVPADDDQFTLETLDSAPSGDDGDFELAPDLAAFEGVEESYQFELPPAAPAEAATETETTDQQTEDVPKAEAPAQAAPPAPPAVSHSVATGGDVLLDVALNEQKESETRRREIARQRVERKLKGNVLVYCPNGHRFFVPEKNRGKQGRCAKCKEPFWVPVRAWKEEEAAAEGAAEGTTEPAAAKTEGPVEITAGKYERWMFDVHLHSVNPEKLKLKAGSLVTEFESVDWGFSNEGLLSAVLLKKGGLFGGVDEKKKPAAREKVLEHLREDKPVDKLPVASQMSFDLEAIEKVRVVYPVPEDDEPMFMGVPVFGTERTWIRFPPKKDTTEVQFASFALSEFRRFVQILKDQYGIDHLTHGINVPMTDTFTTLKCHYSEAQIHVLEHSEFYKNDPALKLQITGRKCAECGIVVSEDSRKKEKIGGANGKGIAKAKCPKCSKKFGDISLFTLEGYAPPEAAAAPAQE